MTNNNTVYEIIQMVGTSSISIEDAIQNAIKKASETVKQIQWFEVLETRGSVEEGDVNVWQVTVKIGFPVED
ncbi:dodecin domain-containing protein [candidate division KSB1 bacterium]|nr:dodecin domain-containing protein [candidate division KSB1 bacterium]